MIYITPKTATLSFECLMELACFDYSHSARIRSKVLQLTNKPSSSFSAGEAEKLNLRTTLFFYAFLASLSLSFYHAVSSSVILDFLYY